MKSSIISYISYDNSLNYLSLLCRNNEDKLREESKDMSD